MAMTSGGGTEKVSTLNKGQKGVSDILSQLIQSGLVSGAGDLGIPVVSKEQETAFADITKGYEAFQSAFESSGVLEALKSVLSGKSSFDVDSEISQDYFDKEIATPLKKDYAKIAKEIRSSYAGFTTRAGKAVSEKYSELMDTLAGKLSEVKYNNMLLKAQLAESAAGRQTQGLSLAGSVLGAPMAASEEYYNAATTYNNTKLTEAARKLPENNPWLSTGLSFMGVPTTQVVNESPSLTGLGQGLVTSQAFANLFASAGSLGSSGSSTTSAEGLATLLKY